MSSIALASALEREAFLGIIFSLLVLRMAFAVPFFVGVAVWTKHSEALGTREWQTLEALGLGYYLFK